MKKIILSIIILTISIPEYVFPQKKIAVSAKVYEHIYRFGKPIKRGKLVEFLLFDKNENIKSRQFYGRRKKKRDIIKYTYNSKNQLIEEVRVSIRHKLRKKTKYEYHSSGKKLLEKEYSSAGKLIKKTQYIFPDNKNHWTKRIKYHSDDVYSKTKVTEFDSKGRRKAGVVYKKNNKIKYKFKIEGHDQFGNELDKIFFRPNGKYLLRYTRKWDDKNRIIYKVYEGKYKIKYEYNSNGNLSKEIHYNPNTNEPTKLRRYVYEYF